MADKSLVMTFLNKEGAKTNISISGIRDDITEAEVSTVMDSIISGNIFTSAGGDLLTKQFAQITERDVTELNVR